MKVGIESSLLFKPRTGVGQYAYKLTEAVSKIDSPIKFEVVRHYLPFRRFTPPIPPSSHLTYRIVRWFPPAVYFQVFKRLGRFLPYDLVALRNYDAFLFFNFVMFNLRKKTAGIVAIHDLSYIHFPDYVQRKNLLYLRRFVPKSIIESRHVIAVSDFTKKDILKNFEISASKISVVPNAVDHKHYYPRPANEVNRLRKKFDLPTKYILFVGTLEPRKNIVGILEAYAELKPELKSDYALVLAGGKGWNDESIGQKIAQLQANQERIILPGYVTDEDLPVLYSGASLFVFPSFYEGFGIPPLEAMACGVPLITSDNSSLPEVVGDAAIKIKADATDDLSRQIAAVLTDQKLAASLRAKGLTQARKFSWEKSAEQLIAVLEKLA